MSTLQESPPSKPAGQQPTRKVVCEQCRHLRSAPFEARKTGCYHPELMVAKQKDRFLDEQQLPGDHTVINRKGDCPKFEPRPPKTSLWQRLFQ